MSRNTKLVYSTDPKDNQKCLKCREFLAECKCIPEAEVKSYKFIAILRIEKAKRAGKTVTVIDQLPKSEIFLRDLTKEIKQKCGSGGTYSLEGKEGLIEIQGDKRDAIRLILEKKGIKVKG